MHTNLRQQLFISFISLAIIPLILVGIVLVYLSFRVQLELETNLEKQITKRISTSVSSYIKQFEDELHTTLDVTQFVYLTNDQQSNIFSKLISYQDGYSQLIFLDSSGFEKVNYSRLKGNTIISTTDYSQQNIFKIPSIYNKQFYSAVRFDEILGEPLINMSLPLIYAETGTKSGVLVATIRLKKIWDLMANTPVDKGERIYVVDETGKVIAHRDPTIVFKGTQFNLPSTDGINKGLEGTQVIIAKDKISLGDQVFYTIAEKDFSEAFSLTINTIIIITILIISTGVVASISFFLTIRQIISPIASLADTARIISQGDLKKRAFISNQNEIGRLALSFNQMTDKLAHSQELLEQKVQERTEELNRKVLELETVNKLMIGREIKMVELKKEIETLKSMK
jgi:nitrogen fixation/metabolism regulation signal transduction histidine kinase